MEKKNVCIYLYISDLEKIGIRWNKMLVHFVTPKQRAVCNIAFFILKAESI